MVYCSLFILSHSKKLWIVLHSCTTVISFSSFDHIPSYAFHSLTGRAKDPKGLEQQQFVLHEQPESNSLPYHSPEVSGLKSSKLIYCDVRDCDANCKEKK